MCTCTRLAYAAQHTWPCVLHVPCCLMHTTGHSAKAHHSECADWQMWVKLWQFKAGYSGTWCSSTYWPSACHCSCSACPTCTPLGMPLGAYHTGHTACRMLHPTGRIGSRQHLVRGVSWGCSGGAQRPCGDHIHQIQLRFDGKSLF